MRLATAVRGTLPLVSAWGPGVFENDDALAWVGDVEEADSARAIETALRAVENEDQRDAPACCEALAAAEVVAAMRGRASSALPAEARDYAARLGEASNALIVRARGIVADLFENSGLQKAWADSDDLDAWEDSIGDLLDRLEPEGGAPML